MRQFKQPSLAGPLDSFTLDDEDDLSTLALALDEVATRLAADPSLRDIEDIEDEPLDSLIERAATAAGLPKATADEWMELAADLARIAHASRYSGGPRKEALERAQSDKELLVDALDQLEEAMLLP